MYIKHIKFENYGPITKLDLKPNLSSNGQPRPLVFIGKNGSGKTLVLGNILDSLIEMKRQKYSDLLEVEQNKYLKLGKKDYISAGADFSAINIIFEEHPNTATYIDLMTRLNYADFNAKYGSLNLQGSTDAKFQKNGFYKKCNLSNKNILDVFENNIISFFPHSRYDHPAWLNKETKIGFKIAERFVDQSSKSIIKHDVIKEIETWILDCLLDREIYEKQIIYGANSVPIFAGYNGKNSDIINLLNELLRIIYSSKFPNLQSARIGIGAKNRRTISIHVQENGKEFVVSPSFSHISSGEAMLLSLFASLLKEYDDLGIKIRNLSDVKGVVLIDEIDLHLHIEFQKTILPELIKKFSNVQFILTSHSPFFLYGMDVTYGKEWDLINLPFGNEISLHDFSEMKLAYEIFVNGFNNLQNTFKTVVEKLKDLSKPLIITEGKTDWKHLKNALIKLNEQSLFLDLDFDFLEYENEIDMGDTHLKALCEQTSKLRNNRKVICIFDRDNPAIIKSMDCDLGSPYKNWGNSVYSFCIPTPSHRSDYKNISIEFYYTDSELMTVDHENNTRLFFSNEVEEILIKSKTYKNSCQSEIRILETPKPEEEYEKKIYSEDVVNIKNHQGVSIAHSKNAFAEKVMQQHAGFDNFNISEFKNIFEIIHQVLNE